MQAVQTEFDRLTEQHQTADELPDEVDARFGELEAEIERLEAKRQAYDPDDVARGGAFVILNHDGAVRIERGFIRPEDEKPQSEAEQELRKPQWQAIRRERMIRPGKMRARDGAAADDEEEDDRPLSDILVRDLTAHRTLGLRLNLSEQPEVAIVAVTHALAAQIFYLGADAHVVGIQTDQDGFGGHADGIEDTPPARHGRIAMPIGQGRCRATSRACGRSWPSLITTAAWRCSPIASH